MLKTIILLLVICGLVRSLGVAVAHLGGPVAAVGPPIPPIDNAPIVTAASSQYFQRNFNRLIVPPSIAPVVPVAPPPAPLIPVPTSPPVFVEPTRTVPAVINQLPPQPTEPNIAIAIATAHAAAPVATILLPPYPFGFPPTFGFVHQEPPVNIPDENTKEPTTQRITDTEATRPTELPKITPIDASNSDNNIVQALPSNENVNLNFYGPPLASNPQFQQAHGAQNNPYQLQRPNPQFRTQNLNSHVQFNPSNPQLPLKISNLPVQKQQPLIQYQAQLEEFPPYPSRQQAVQQNQQKPQYLPYYQPRPQKKGRPQKLKTIVEVVPVPLAYITPPPLQKSHAHIKIVKHVYSFVPTSSAKIILKPIKNHPVRLIKLKTIGVKIQDRSDDRDIEMTTLNPFPRPNTKPPKI